MVVSCHSSKKANNSNNAKVILLDTLVIRPKDPKQIYHESVALEMQLLHTKLDLKFDWQKEFLIGKANLFIKPYFYSSNQIALNAVGFEITDLFLVRNGQKTKVEYNYDNQIISINLGKMYSKNDTIQLQVDYVAKPNNLELNGDKVSQDEKGLYFVNAQLSDPNKPQQIYTQSETQSASCWYPTLDAPNQRATQEISLTVENKFTTLSNGLLIKQIDNGNGTRTDFWKQSRPSAPYLSMIAIGEFSTTKQMLGNLELSYLVETKFGKEALATFGDTPAMIEFFSKKLGVNFPWEKYAQVVVCDYPGGSMENTSATLHGDFMNVTARERLDDAKEQFITHELFHQWFGNLVTCESWSNVALNESFATYGEYLWLEYRYGREEADIHHQDDLQAYFNEAKSKQVNMVRYDYKEADDMFDRHSYEKGGRIIHMLRNVVGDEAFFAALTLYLQEHKFSSVEMSDLRLAFEKVCGKDMNWFFNQWFFSSGHPELFITYEYNEVTKKQTVRIEQMQNLKETPLYRVPLDIDIYAYGKKERHRVVLKKQKEDFIFDVTAKPNLVNVDAEKMLLCKKNDIKTQDEWIFQYKNAPLYLDRYEAIEALGKEPGAKSKDIVLKALNDKNWNIRNCAIRKLEGIQNLNETEAIALLTKLALKDEKSSVRANAVEMLGKISNEESLMEVYKTASSDLSYTVAAQALNTLYDKNPEQGFEEAKRFEADSNIKLLTALINIFSSSGDDNENSFFIDKEPYFDGYSKYSFVQLYGNFLLGRSDSVINTGIPVLEKNARLPKIWWVRLAAIQAIDSLMAMYASRENELKSKFARGDKAKKTEANSESKSIDEAHAQYEKLKGIYEKIKSEEKDKNLLRYLN
jgi:aminopeptidase N